MKEENRQTPLGMTASRLGGEVEGGQVAKHVGGHGSPYEGNSAKWLGNSWIERSSKSGRAARRRTAVGKGPRTPITRTPARRAISTSSGESPTYTYSSGSAFMPLSARRIGAGCGFRRGASSLQTHAWKY